MAKNKALLVGLLWIALCIPSYTLVGNDGHTVRVIARKYIGVTEKGGNNKGFTDKGLQAEMAERGWRPGYAWCSFFVKTVLDLADIPNTVTGYSPSSYNHDDVIFTNGRFKTKDYNSDDVLVMSLSYSKFRNSRFKGIGHTGIVERVKEKSVVTIEGNTTDAGTRDTRTGKDGVYRKVRPLSKNIHITRWKKVR